MPDFCTIASGSNVTSALFNARGGGITICVPRSLNPGDLRLQACQSSGASAAGDGFFDVQVALPRTDYGPFTVYSGAGPVWVSLAAPPTPFVRLTSTMSQTQTVSFAIFPYRPN